jgi:AcrR family transcriptional regulator
VAEPEPTGGGARRRRRGACPAAAEAPARKARRSHAERTAETRARLIAAVVESIAETGLARTTAPEIARRAGVTWGAVQHHFGGKDGMLVAVLDDSFRRFAERMESIPLEGTTLEQRAALFIERSWAHFSGPLYRSTYEILLHYLGRGRRGGDWRERMFREWDRLWRRLFSAAPVPRSRHYVLQHYTISVLTGLAATLMLEGDEATIRPAELALLEATLARELAGRG